MNVYRTPPTVLPSLRRIRTDDEIQFLLNRAEEATRNLPFAHPPPPFVPHEGKPLYHRPLALPSYGRMPPVSVRE